MKLQMWYEGELCGEAEAPDNLTDEVVTDQQLLDCIYNLFCQSKQPGWVDSVVHVDSWWESTSDWIVDLFIWPDTYPEDFTFEIPAYELCRLPTEEFLMVCKDYGFDPDLLLDEYESRESFTDTVYVTNNSKEIM